MPSSEDFSVKKIINGENLIGDAKKHDLEEKFLYVHVVKAKGLGFSRARHPNPCVEIAIGQLRKTTESCRDISNPEWNRVFAFIEDEIRANDLLVRVKLGTHLIGYCSVDLDEIPTSVSSNCALAPRWYKLQNENDDWVEKEVLLAVFSGYQADEEWNLNALRNNGTDVFPDIRSQLYVTPKLWYLRVNVIGAYDLIPGSGSSLCRDPQFFVKASLGNQTLTSRISRSRNPVWNQNMMFVTTEPFEEPLIILVQDMIPSTPIRYHDVGRCVIPLKDFERRSDDKAVNVIWHNLETRNPEVVTRIYMKVCLEGGYHVEHESANYYSDLRPTDKKLWKPKIGVLELGILRATGLMSMKTRDGQQTTDAYCVAKYGKQWVRTRTIDGSCTPTWNEVFRWDVFDPYTVVTVAMFDSCHVHEAEARDSRLGKVRIRLSTLRTGRVYTLSYPLLVIHPGGVQKMGEIELAVRFTCSSWLKLMRTYSQPLLPKMHYIRPIVLSESVSLRCRASEIVSMCLARSEPPLKKDVVDYILDLDSYSWSLRRSKINFSRIAKNLTWSWNIVDDIFKWKSTPKTLFVFFCILVCIFMPHAIMFLPLLTVLIGLISFFWSSDLPPHIDMALSQAASTSEFDLDEETDTLPSSRPPKIVSKRYERLREVAGAAQTTLGYVSGLVERLFLLISWRDRRATALFLMFCLISGISLVLLRLTSWYVYSRYMYHVPLFQMLQVLAALYLMRPPRFRRLELLSWVFNFFWRLPSRNDDLY